MSLYSLETSAGVYLIFHYPSSIECHGHGTSQYVGVMCPVWGTKIKSTDLALNADNNSWATLSSNWKCTSKTLPSTPVNTHTQTWHLSRAYSITHGLWLVLFALTNRMGLKKTSHYFRFRTVRSDKFLLLIFFIIPLLHPAPFLSLSISTPYPFLPSVP